MGADHLSEKLLTPGKIPALAPAPAPAREKEDENACGIPYNRYLELFGVTLIVVIFAGSILFSVTSELDTDKKGEKGHGSAAVKKVISLLPEFGYLAGVTSAASYLAVTLHCILPRFSFCFGILNLILLLAVVMFVVGCLLYMHYVFFYVFGVILAIIIFFFANYISDRRQKEKEALGQSRV